MRYFKKCMGIVICCIGLSLTAVFAADTQVEEPSFWEKTKSAFSGLWDQTKEVSGDAADATKEGSADAWD